MTACPKPSSPAGKAGVYTRISSDPSGQRAGVDRQRADCEAHCHTRGWEVVEVFCDNDASAYGRKPRHAYERMLAAVATGKIDAIVTWHNDRLHRSPKELEAFIDLVERSGVRLAVVTGGDYDLTTPDGRLSARIVGAVARKESEDRSRRVRRKHLELAELGRPAGQLGWGVRSEDEREFVREAAPPSARRRWSHDDRSRLEHPRRARSGRRTLDRGHTAQGAVGLADGRAA